MKKPTVDDYIQQGIYGPKEIKPEERRLYLGTFRERVLLVLTKRQVSEEKIPKEVVESIKKHPDAQLLLNGHMNYSFLSKYVQLASDFEMASTVVTNKDYDTKYGLVLAETYAVNKENIFLLKEEVVQVEKQEKETQEEKCSFLKKLWDKI